jgi:hypothetical protein
VEVDVTKVSSHKYFFPTKALHLPNELLECILLNLRYNEVSKVRQVCRQFRDVGNGILNMEIDKLTKCAESELAAVEKEEEELPRKTPQSGAGLTERAQNNSTGPEDPSPSVEYRTMKKVQKPSNPECYTPSSA